MITLNDITVELDGRRALGDVSTSFRKGELVCLLGPNGAGKTTLLKAIAGLLPFSGRLMLDGEPADQMATKARARAISYLPQGHVAHWPIPVRDAVAIGRMPHGGGPGIEGPSHAAAIEAALSSVGIAALAERPVTALSGGEKARVMLARALAVEAPVLLADEPIAALDPVHQLVVMELLVRHAAEGRIVIAALHDLTLATRFGHRVLVLEGGRVAADGRPEDVLTDALLARVFRLEAARLAHAGQPVLVPWLPQGQLRR